MNESTQDFISQIQKNIMMMMMEDWDLTFIQSMGQFDNLLIILIRLQYPHLYGIALYLIRLQCKNSIKTVLRHFLIFLFIFLEKSI